MLDADIRDFFGQLDRDWLRKFLGHRIADKRVLRLVDKWLAAGVIEDGRWSETPQGSPQGASVSPLLANIYLHYVLDLWADWWRRHVARGEVIIVRFADDFVVGFEDYQDACRFLHDLRERFAKFGLELHPGKTRLIEFGRFAAADRQKRGRRETGDVRLPRLHAYLREDAGRAVLGAAHHGLEADAGQAGRGQRPAAAAPASACPGARAMAGQRGARALRLLRRARQPQGGGGVPHPGDTALAGGAAAPQPALPPGLETHEPPGDPVAAASPRDASLPRRALRRSYPRQEPSALAAHAGICAGGRPQGRSLPR